jgi:hypothetical protein
LNSTLHTDGSNTPVRDTAMRMKMAPMCIGRSYSSMTAAEHSAGSSRAMLELSMDAERRCCMEMMFCWVRPARFPAS